MPTDYAHDAGGWIYARYGSEVKVRNVNFINNSCSGANSTVVGISDEPVINGGGAIAGSDANTSITVKNSYFTNNTSVIAGGGGAINNSFNSAKRVEG